MTSKMVLSDNTDHIQALVRYSVCYHEAVNLMVMYFVVITIRDAAVVTVNPVTTRKICLLPHVLMDDCSPLKDL